MFLVEFCGAVKAGQNLSSGNVKDAAEIGGTTVNAWAVVIDPICSCYADRFLENELRREVLCWTGSFEKT
jgi:hypothetical protein